MAWTGKGNQSGLDGVMKQKSPGRGNKLKVAWTGNEIKVAWTDGDKEIKVAWTGQ